MARRSKNRRHRRQLQLEKHRPQILAQKAASDHRHRHEHAHGQSLPANFHRWKPPMQRIMEELCPAGFALDTKLVTDDGWYCHQASMLTLNADDSTMLLAKHCMPSSGRLTRITSANWLST